MLQYGHTFDQTFDPTKTNTYNLFVSIYKDPVLTKTKDTGNSSVYMGKTSCLLINECRYLIATVSHDDNQPGTKINLSKLNWTNFQTRTLKGKFPCDTCNSANITLSSPSLELIERTDKYTQYKNDEHNIKISLLHTKTNNLYEYPNGGDIISALELYQTVISF